ncbi:hypothetical protein NW752_003472 [Fusarium irregulare]|uniref:C2H2-type domain-containing protein n=1 Tax=Fusarium irregulare TaxID=2494466 RepID=A0A9W8PS80_9HYPO|nr:hypothetical protein NW766_004543 [Fusarium irregulare]KAJ4023015.1 hypothetical protein NW752_003472 [Fusarium irregulare]
MQHSSPSPSSSPTRPSNYGSASPETAASSFDCSNSSHCGPCKRYFRDDAALDQHILAKHHDTYCWRCDRHFTHVSGLEQHVANSSKHHVCTHCDGEPDYDTEEDLNEHLEEFHNACLECNEIFYDEEDLIAHDVEMHNRCATCQRFFDSPSNLLNHKKVHLEKNIKCLACPRMFISNSAMMLHMEHGTCESGANLRVIKNLVADWYEDYGSVGHHHEDDFRCENCGSHFLRLSALLQHAESENCDAAVWDFYRIFVHIEYNQDAFQLFDY